MGEEVFRNQQITREHEMNYTAELEEITSANVNTLKVGDRVKFNYYGSNLFFDISKINKKTVVGKENNKFNKTFIVDKRLLTYRINFILL